MNSVLRTVSHPSHCDLSVYSRLERLVLTFRIHQDMTLPICLALLISLHYCDSLRCLTLQSLFESCYTREVEAVRVPDVVTMVNVKMFSHSILGILPLDGILVLSQAMDHVVPRLPVVIGQNVGHFASDVILDTRPCVGGTFQSRFAGPAPLRPVKTPG